MRGAVRLYSAKQVKQASHSQAPDNDHTGYEPPPNEAVNHIFRLEIQCASGTAARIRLKHQLAITTSLCAHLLLNLPFGIVSERQRLQFAVDHGMN